MFFIITSAIHVSAGFSADHQELIKLYVQPWVLSCFPAVYRWCGWVGNGTVQRTSDGFTTKQQASETYVQYTAQIT
jgi:hypothetical protein